MSNESPNARAIFTEAVESVPAERWSDFLDERCGDDHALRSRVQRLLDAQLGIGGFMDKPAAAAIPALDQTPLEQAGTQIGPYKLLRQIGEGGMGVVFMAEQEQPVRRKVALKVIRPGMDSRQVIARFEAERQALAIMDHINIARVLDAGTTEQGRPYFVMELVHGVSITQYCDDNHLTPRQRLELFVPVCQAIQHAHTKGIIHRDIKPSNVMITRPDPGAPGVPKVIDFGVAKATEQKLTERTLFTQYGTMVGTLQYMSPEQAEMSPGAPEGIDTRSDVYSLGVLLYELLTGSTPFTHKRLKAAAHAEILRMIREEEPPKPSTRLSSRTEFIPFPADGKVTDDGMNSVLHETDNGANAVHHGSSLASIAAQRSMEPAKLSKLVRGELDWIVMKTLEKDRNRRYETASGLAADVQRYLDDQPVEACPPSASYRVWKFTRRNKGPVLAASLIVLALLGGVIGTTIGLIRAEEAGRAEMEQRQRAETNFRKSIQGITQLLLRTRQPEVSRTPELKRFQRALCDEARQFYEEFNADTNADNGIRWEIGVAYVHLGIIYGIFEEYAEAEAIHRKAIVIFDQLTADFPTEADYRVEAADARVPLAELFWNISRRREAAELFCEIEDIFGLAHRETPTPRVAMRYASFLADCPDFCFRDPGRAAVMAEQALKVTAEQGRAFTWWQTLALANYRVGNWQRVIEAATNSMEFHQDRENRAVIDYLLLAMANWQLGEEVKARRWYAKATAHMDNRNPKDQGQLRYRYEAEALLGVVDDLGS